MRILIAALSLIFFSGCAMLEPKNTTGSLEPSSVVKFSDVPVPAGFKLLPKVSYSFETATTRVGILKYQGRASRDQLVGFYKEQMPMYHWTLLNIIEYGDCLLNFDRETETCIITLTPQGRSSYQVSVALGPKNLQAKKTEKPLK